MFLETFFASFRQFYFLIQTEYFAWAIAFALWPFLVIFKMLSFFEYKPFLRAVFLHRITLKCLLKLFSQILFFDLISVFGMGYSLCIVAIFDHFQNALICRILAVFKSRLFQ